MSDFDFCKFEEDEGWKRVIDILMLCNKVFVSLVRHLKCCLCFDKSWLRLALSMSLRIMSRDVSTPCMLSGQLGVTTHFTSFDRAWHAEKFCIFGWFGLLSHYTLFKQIKLPGQCHTVTSAHLRH